MATKDFRQVIPAFWKGIRDNVDGIAILEEEWQDASNHDHDGVRPGLTEVVVLEAGVGVVGLHYYNRADGSQHRVAALANGKLYEDSSLALSGMSGQPPVFTSGLGTVIVLDPSGTPHFRDAADNTWKTLPTPSAWVPKVGSIDRIGRRLYLAPTDLGPDAWGYSAVDKVTKWASTDGGGQEIVGGDGQPIGGIGYFVGDNMAIYKYDMLYLREGADPANWKFRAISADVGTRSPRALVALGHGNFFAHSAGASLVNAVGSVLFPPLSDPITTRWVSLARVIDFAKVHACWDAITQRMNLWVPNDAGVVQRLFRISFREHNVTEHVVQATCSAWDGQYIHIGRTDGRISKISGTTDHGTPIDAYIVTKVFGDPLTQKSFGSDEQIIMLFRGAAGVVVSVTPTMYVDDFLVVGDAVSVTLVGGLSRLMVPLPTTQGWGLELKIQATGVWKFVGLVAPEQLLGEI